MAHQHRFLKHRMIERDTEREPQIVETGMGFFCRNHMHAAQREAAYPLPYNRRVIVVTVRSRERERRSWDTEKEIEKKAETDHRNHKKIERKTYGPSTPVKFFRFGMIERDTEMEPQIVETGIEKEAEGV
ncbi:uncharacterized protein LOC112023393 isoform X1 [Quercus suber]|uniref:uncharacterized protein LOC112023393 isoform X1 n=1 Tax=Quercus suber TaxID=58331 RepID=UPI0032DFC549